MLRLLFLLALILFAAWLVARLFNIRVGLSPLGWNALRLAFWQGVRLLLRRIGL